VITGYNTDVEYDGVVYHVQTEDKGLQTPIILSLVYTGGAILASKRSPYDDLIARGFDEGILAQRLQRQHKLICAAVHAGRIEDLKRMGAASPYEKPPERREAIAEEPAAVEPSKMATAGEDKVADKQEETAVTGDRISISEPAVEDGPTVSLLEEKELRAGESVTLRLRVTRAFRNGRGPAPRARVTVKVLGTSFRPTSTFSITGNDGIASILVPLPMFKTGRAAILVQAEVDDQTVELRRIILPKSPPDL
jgi:hypothetical protein